MKMDNHATSRVDTIDVYKRLWQALDGDDIAQDVSDLFGEMAQKYCAGTGVKAGRVFPEPVRPLGGYDA